MNGGIMDKQYDFSGLKALIFNGTLTKSPSPSHTEKLIKVGTDIMEKHGVKTEIIRQVDHDIATGVYPDMREKGWKTDEWPEIYKKVQEADILILAGPIWLGDNSSQTKKIIERLYACSSLLNDKGQYAYYGKVGGCLITGNEDGGKHCAMNVLYSLQHLGYTVPPQADTYWVGEAGPGPSYGEDGAGLDNDFTNRNATFMAWNLMHLAHMLREAGGFPAYGNQRSKWDAGARFDFENPEYR
jgi:multimeric flavodoxin WrbA